MDHPVTTEHTDYPHTPGTLYDCAACESECFCINRSRDEGDAMCVHCALNVDVAAVVTYTEGDSTVTAYVEPFGTDPSPHVPPF